MDVLEDGSPYAFGEIIPQDSQSVHLARLLIDKSELRGKGLGKAFIERLLKEVNSTFGVSSVDLYLLADKQAEIRCYEKVGFCFMEKADLYIPFDGQLHKILKMHRDI